MTFPETALPIKVEINVNGMWEDLVPLGDVRGFTAPGGGIRLSSGRQNEQVKPQPGQGSLALNHRDGRYDSLNPRSDLFENLPIGTRIRISITDSRIAVEDQIRAWHELTAFPPIWEKTGTDVWVPVRTSGVFQKLTERDKGTNSALRQYYLSFGDRLLSYLPLEESSQNETSTSSNLVDGATDVVYSTGGPPDFPRLPRWGLDDRCPGSAPLPEWPVVTYFGWSRGSTVITSDGPPWQVHITFNVPSGQTSLTLCEWKTNGTLLDWRLKVDSGGQLSLNADGLLFETLGSIEDVNNGEWHTLAIIARDVFAAGGNPILNVLFIYDGETVHDEEPGESAGAITRIRPRPMYDSIAGDPPPIGLGHMAIIDGDTLEFDPPALGFDNERATDRITRLAEQNNIPVEVIDRFPPEPKFIDVSTYESAATEAAFNVDAPIHQPGDMLVIFHAADESNLADMGRPQGGALWLFLHEQEDSSDPAPNHANKVWWKIAGDSEPATYSFTQTASARALVSIAAVRNVNQTLTPKFFGSTQSGASGVITSFGPELFTDRDLELRWTSGDLSTGTFDDLNLKEPPFYTDVTDNLRSGGFVIAKLVTRNRHDAGTTALGLANIEPNAGTHFFIVENGTLQPAGRVTVILSAQENEFSTQRMGAQRRARLLELFQDAESVGLGILSEARNLDLGLRYNALGALYNYIPKLILTYDQANLSDDFLPVVDTQLIHNDVTVQDGNTNTARAVLRTGPNSTEQIGTFDKGPIILRVHSHTQLNSSAHWILHVRTVNEHRFPELTVELNRQPYIDDPVLFAAVAAIKVGDVIRVTNPPTWLPPGPLDLLVIGDTQDPIDQLHWTFKWNCVPASVYNVGIPFNPNGLFLNGSQFASTSDDPALDITGDISIRAFINPATWNPDEEEIICAKWEAVGDQRSFWVSLVSGGLLRFRHTTDGTLGTLITNSFTTPLDPDFGVAIRIDLDVDDGLGNRVYQWFTGPTIDGPWTLRETDTVAGTTSIFSGTAPLEIADQDIQLNAFRFKGQIQQLVILNGLAGAEVANPDFTAQPDGTTSFTDASGRLWTVTGQIIQAAGNALRDTADSKILTAFISGTDTEFEVTTDQGPRWTDNSDHFPIEIETFGTTLNVTDIGPSAEDTFTRIESNGWGTSDSGHVWNIVQGAAAIFSVNGTQGVMDAANQGPGAFDYGVVTLDKVMSNIEIRAEIDAVNDLHGLVIHENALGWFEFVIDINLNRIRVNRIDIDGGGVKTSTNISGDEVFTSSGTPIMRIQSKNGLHRFKVWNSSSSEPARWNFNIFDTTHLSGNVGCMGNGDTTEVFNFDNFQVIHPQLFTVDLAPTNGINKVVPIGKAISLRSPAICSLRGARI